MRQRPIRRRAAFSLLEVLVALAIFLFSLVAIGRLVTLGADQAFEARLRSQAVQICQSKMAEVAAGAVPLQSQGDTPLDEDPEWRWSLDCQQNTAANLWNVTVKASRQMAGGGKVELRLQELVLDPSVRGSAFDAWASSSSSSSSSSGANSSNSGAGTGPGSGSATGSASPTAGASGGQSKPVTPPSPPKPGPTKPTKGT